jgi:hypothetical protein
VGIFSSKISKSKVSQKFKGSKECARGLKYLNEQISEEIVSIRVQHEGLRKFLIQNI